MVTRAHPRMSADAISFKNTIAELQADTDLAAGMVVETLGYFARNDGGGNRYEIVTDTYTPETAPFVIVASGGANAVGNQDGQAGQAFPRNAAVHAWLRPSSGAAAAWIADPDLAGTDYFLASTDASIGIGGGHNNIAIALAHRVQAETGRDVYVIIDARDEAIAGYIATGGAGDRYTSLATTVPAALAAIPGAPATIDVFLWAHGDTDRARTAAAYKADLDSLWTRLTGESWYSAPVFIGAENVSYDDDFEELDDNASVNEGLADFCADLPAQRKIASADRLPSRDVNHLTGDSLFNIGWSRCWDQIGLAEYVEGRPDGGAWIELHAAGLIAKALWPTGEVRAEAYGCLSGQEAAWQLRRANAFAVAKDMKLTAAQEFDIAWPVNLGDAGSTIVVDMSQAKLNAVAGGGLTKTGPAIVLSLRDTNVYMPPLHCNKLCSGVEIYGPSNNAQIFRPDAWRFASARGAFAIRISAAQQAGCTLHDPAGSEWGVADAQFRDEANFLGAGLVLDGNDAMVRGGHPGHAKRVVLFTRASATTVLEKVHPYCGNPRIPLEDLTWSGFVVLENRSAKGNTVYDCYLDGGYVIDYASGLEIKGGFHFTPDNGFQVMTEPYTRIAAKSIDANFLATIDGFATSIGLFFNDDPDDLGTVTDHWDYSDQRGPGALLRLAQQEYTLYASDTDGLPCVVEAKKAGEGNLIKKRQVFPNGYVDEDTQADQRRMLVPVLRVDGTTAGSPSASETALYLGSTDTGLARIHSNGNVDVKIAGVTEWFFRASDGSLLPLGDNQADLGGPLNRVKNLYGVKGHLGTLNLSNLPTSATGLDPGDLWNDGGTLKIA